MVPLPIVSEPFSRVAMDIVGPLPRSWSGHKYIIVLCDYARRYPEAIPLKNTDSETIAEELLTVFSRVGISQEILTDQGSNFQSQLLKHLYRLLLVDAVRTSPYHPQTDGLVERFNQTLKAMLRKTAMKSGKDWDKLIPALLFAYREVPQESTGYSPFELLYERDVRGPLDVLKHSFEGNHSIRNQNVVSHILLQSDKLEAMKEAVHNNLRKAQQQQKVWYDENSRERSFAVGDWVLVLLPTSASKLTAQWQGPYRVVECMGKVNYAVHMHDHRKHRRVFHVNMLRPWHPPVSVFSVQQVDGENEEEDLSAWKDSNEGGQMQLGSTLTANQLAQLDKLLLEEFESCFTTLPAQTTIAVHHISTGEVRPPPYRLPHAFRQQVKLELEEMLPHGIIQHSTSDWAFPLVLVKKKDASLQS